MRGVPPTHYSDRLPAIGPEPSPVSTGEAAIP